MRQPRQDVFAFRTLGHRSTLYPWVTCLISPLLRCQINQWATIQVDIIESLRRRFQGSGGRLHAQLPEIEAPGCKQVSVEK
jgi:hypothetical protein